MIYLNYLVFQYRNHHGSYNFRLNYLFIPSYFHILILFKAHQVTPRIITQLMCTNTRNIKYQLLNQRSFTSLRRCVLVPFIP
jgi:hypothetical protein